MIKALLLSTALLALSTPALADGSLTFGATSNYVVKGLSQSNQQPSYSVKYQYTSKYVYVGASAQNVDFRNRTNAETDIFAGLTTKVGPVDLDLGLVDRDYAKDYARAQDWQETHLTASVPVGPTTVSGTLAYSQNYYNLGTRTLWSDVSVKYPLTEKLDLSAGYGYLSTDRKTAFKPYSVYTVGAEYQLTDHLSLDAEYNSNSLNNYKYSGDNVSFGVKAKF